MPAVSIDCLPVGFAVFVLAAINLGVARSVDRHLDTNLGAIRDSLRDITSTLRDTARDMHTVREGIDDLRGHPPPAGRISQGATYGIQRPDRLGAGPRGYRGA
jgi:hypothetical protein